MAEGTRLKDLSENLKALEEMMNSLTTECHNTMDSRLQQLEGNYSKKLQGLVQQIEELQQVEQQRHEAQQIEAVRRHEQLLKLISTSHTTVKTNNSPIMIKEPHHNFDYQPGSSLQGNMREDKGKGILPSA